MIIRAVVIFAAYAVITLGQDCTQSGTRRGVERNSPRRDSISGRPVRGWARRKKTLPHLVHQTCQQDRLRLRGPCSNSGAEAFFAASGANPFFWYSALTTAILMVLMFAFGVRVMDEKRKLWHAAEILNDVWNDAQYARATAEDAIGRHNAHTETCNRVIEGQASGRASPAALETTDARNEWARVRGELDNIDSERKLLKAKLDEKEKLVDDLSARLSVLEKDQNGGPAQAKAPNGASGSGESESRLIARINQLTQQLETEKRKNRTLKGA